MPISIMIFIIIAMVLLILLLSFSLRSEAKKIIQENLEESGATNIVIQPVWFNFDRDTLTFSVAFTNANGKKLLRSCKLRYWGLLSVDNEIFWSDSWELGQNSDDIISSKYVEFSKKIQSHLNEELPTYEIAMTLSMLNSDDFIIMMNYGKAFKNVFRCKLDGSIVWQSELPTNTNDVYTNIKWEDDKLTAFSRSCNSVVLDVETGKISSKTK